MILTLMEPPAAINRIINVENSKKMVPLVTQAYRSKKLCDSKYVQLHFLIIFFKSISPNGELTLAIYYAS